MLELTRVLVEPHHLGTGYSVVLHRPDSRLFSLGLDKHAANQGERFDECRTDFDHVAFHVADRAELDAWADHLDRQGVPHSPRTEIAEPFPTPTWCFATPTISNWS